MRAVTSVVELAVQNLELRVVVPGKSGVKEPMDNAVHLRDQCAMVDLNL